MKLIPKLSKADLEATCVDCGLCCYASAPLGKGSVMVPELRCKHLALEKGTGKSCCNVYEDRHDVAKGWCLPLADAIEKGVFPEQCPYVSDMKDYVGSAILSDTAYDMVRPQIKKAIEAGGKPEWVNDQHWDEFIGINKGAYSGKGTRTGSPGNYTYTYPEDSTGGSVPAVEELRPLKFAASIASGDWTKARSEIEGILQNRDYYMQGGEKTSKDVVIEGHPHLDGVHNWDGSILITPKVAESAQKFAKAFSEDPEGVKSKMRAYEARGEQLKALAAKRDEIVKPYRSKLGRGEITPKEYLAFKNKATSEVEDTISSLMDAGTSEGIDLLRQSDYFMVLVHETTHSYGPMKQEAYRSAGMVVEEVSTEVLARRTMNENFGVPTSWSRRSGAYQKWIDPIIDQIQDTYDVPADEAWKILENASDTLKTMSEGGADSGSLVTQFSSSFSPTGNPGKDLKSSEIAAQHPVTGEWVDMSGYEHAMQNAVYDAFRSWEGL